MVRKPCFVCGNHLSMPKHPVINLILDFGFPYLNLGFSLVGFTAFHSNVSVGLRHCGTFMTFTISEDLGVHPPLDAPIYLDLFFHLAQTLLASQLVRAWTFLYFYAKQRLPEPQFIIAFLLSKSKNGNRQTKGSGEPFPFV